MYLRLRQSKAYNSRRISIMEIDGVEHNSSSPRNVSAVNNMQTRLQAAAVFAKETFIKDGVSRTAPAIEILGERGCSIVIDEITDPHDGNIYFVIYREMGHCEIIKIPKDGYRYVYLRNIVGCSIFVKCKLLRIMFQECINCKIYIHSPVIGMVEFFKCKYTKLVVRILRDEDVRCPIPITRIESCESFHIRQLSDCMVYLVKLSVDINSIVEGNAIRHNIGKLLWGEQEQLLVCISRKDGYSSTSIWHALNDTTHHVIVKSLENTNKLMGD